MNPTSIVHLQKYQLILAASWIIVPMIIIFGAEPEYSLSNRIYASALYIICTFSIIQALRDHYLIPVLALVMMNYILFFVIPIFHETEVEIFSGTILVDNELMDTVFLITIMAVSSIQIGYLIAGYWFEHVKFPRFSLPIIENKLFYFAIVSIFGGLFLHKVINIPPSFAKLMSVLLSWELGVAILCLMYYRINFTTSKKILIIVVMCIIVFNGFTSGLTQNVIQPLVIWYVGRWLVLKQIPFKSFFFVAVIFLALQPVKSEYRDVVWYGDSSNIQLSNSFEKAAFYGGLVYDYWIVKENDRLSMDTTSRRSSLLLNTEHIVDLTPEIVPYQEGESLLYIVYGLIPRILWPDKPIAQEANVFFADKYGIGSERSNNSTRYGMGHVGEVYSNFGMLGIVPTFLFIGFMYYVPIYFLPVNNRVKRDTSLSKNQIRNHTSVAEHDTTNIALEAMLLVMVINFMIIGSTVGNVFGSVIQQMLVQALVIHLLVGKR